MSIIGSTTADRARTYLPGSVVVTETLEDADASARTPGKPWGQTVHMPSGEVGIREIPDSERAEDEALSERLLELARTLEVIPSRGDDPDAQLVSLWDDSDERPEFRALIGTLLAARRTGRPIYSDDRFIRAGARSLGLDAFGTLALVDALAERKLVDDGIRRAVRRALAVRGGWGVELSGDELIAIARDVHFELTFALRSVLNDRAGWRAKPSGRWQEVLALLTAVYMEAPQHLTAFVEATLDAAQRAAPEVRSGMWLEMMLLLAWSPGDGPVTDDRCFQALLASAKILPPRFKPTGYDPVVHPLRSMLNSAPTRSRRLLNELFRIYLRRLRLTDQTHALYEMFDFDVRPPTTPGL
jgi:hypothetical protein